MIEIAARSISARSRAAFDGIDGIGQTDVCDAGVDEHFRLADLGAADADRAAVDLPFRDDRRLVGLGVRPQLHAGAVGELLRAIDVALDARVVDQDLRSGKIARAHA